MSLCQSIDTLSMAYLDDELAAEERRELELHLVDCTSCRHHVDGERADLDLVRTALAAPPAPDLVKARIARALDDEDRRIAHAERARRSRWLLPGTAIAAAAAALIVFVRVGPVTTAADQPVAAVAHEVVRQQTRSLPLEVQGASTDSWLRTHFGPVQPPRFSEPTVQLVGARATAVQGHDAALLRYLVAVGGSRVSLTAMLIADLRGDELRGGQALQVGNLTLHVHDADGQPAVTYIDEHRVGYVFTSERLTAQELVSLVVRSDLIGRAQQQLR